MSKSVRRLLLALTITFLAVQFVRPDRTNPPIEVQHTIHAQVQTPPEVTQILERSCRDCHSNQTSWPWYSHVAPVSWFVIEDVNDARKHMNLSEWAKYKPAKAAELLEGICDETSHGEMPLRSYRLMHRDAKLTAQDVRALCEWSRTAREQLAMRPK